MERASSYDPELLDAVFNMHLQGKSNAEMAKELGQTIGTIDRIYYKVLGLQRREFKKGIKPMRTVYPEQVKHRILRLFYWGYNPREISEDLKVRVEHVNRIIEDAPIKSRIAG